MHQLLKKITLPLVLILICINSNFAQQVKLISYNIGSSNWLGNRDSVVARIVDNNPDVFCAIEATQNSRPFFEAAFPNYSMLQTFASPNVAESHIFLEQECSMLLTVVCPNEYLWRLFKH